MMPFLHWWFGYFARSSWIRPISRVVAAGSGAIVTAVVISRPTRSRWWAQLPLATACWALLGKVEGDDPSPGEHSHPRSWSSRPARLSVPATSYRSVSGHRRRWRRVLSRIHRPRVRFERFTDRARRILVLGQEEARLLNHGFIGTEHILLGLLTEGEGIGAQALQILGVSVEAVREEVVAMVASSRSPTMSSPAFTSRAMQVLQLSAGEAFQLGHDYVGTEHILLGLVREGNGVGAQILVSLGADLPRVRQEVMRQLRHPSEAQGGR